MILFLLILGINFSAMAQLPDLMGSLAIDGMMTAQSAKGYSAASLQMKKNSLMQSLQIKNMEIQTHMLSHAQNVSRETFQIAGYPAAAQKEEGGRISITVQNVEKAICEGIDGRFAGAKKIEINSKQSHKNNCFDKNTIKFYY